MSFVTNAIGKVVGGLTGANAQASAAQGAANSQEAAAMAGIQQQQQEFNQVQQLESPFVNAGTGALGGYNSTLSQLANLTGANGNGAQQSAINGLTSNPLYTTSMALGQQSILANASATGGLRGGNTIASLGYLPNQVLSNTLQTQIGNLQSTLGGYGNLVGVGQNAAAGVGNAGMSTGNNITNLLGQQGSAQAGAQIAGGNATASGINSLGSLLGSTAGQNLLNAAGTGISNAGSFLMSLF